MMSSFLTDVNPLPPKVYLKKIPQLPLTSKKTLCMNYGASKTVPVNDVEVPMSPTSTMAVAGQYLLDQQKKGFVSSSMDLGSPQDVFKSSLVSFTYKKKRSAADFQPDAKRSKDEKYLDFWLNLDCVEKIRKEISMLPMEEKIDNAEMISRLMDQAASVVRVMKHDNKLTTKGKTKTENNQIMRHFVDSVRDIRFSLISSKILDGTINVEKMTNEQKLEFAGFASPPPPLLPSESMTTTTTTTPFPTSAEGNNYDQIEDSSADLIFAQRAEEEKMFARTSQALPSLYRVQMPISNCGTSRRQIQQNMRNTVNIMKNALSSTSPPPPMPQQQDQYQQDQYQQQNQQQYQQFQKLQKTADEGEAVKPMLLIPGTQSDFVKSSRSQTRQSARILTSPVKRKRTLSMQPLRVQTSRKPGLPIMGSKTPTLDGEQLSSRFWKEEDPLSTVRSNVSEDEEFEPCSVFDKLTAPLKIDFRFDQVDVKDPFTLTSTREKEEREKKEEEMKNDDKEKKDESKEIGGNEEDGAFSTSLKEGDKGFCNRESCSSLPSKYSSSAKSDAEENDMQFLTEQTVAILQEDMGNEMHKRLEEIWDRLGFSIVQKLSMVVKYSENIEVSRRLAEALGFWEQAYSVVQQYETKYKLVKDYLKTDILLTKNKEITFEEITNELATAENLLKDVSKRLKMAFGDDLIIHRKRVLETIAIRRMKLKYLISMSIDPTLILTDLNNTHNAEIDAPSD